MNPLQHLRPRFALRPRLGLRPGLRLRPRVRTRPAAVVLAAALALGALADPTQAAAPPRAGGTAVAPQAALRTGMTWSVLGRQGGYVHVGADGQTNPYTGDTAIDQYRSALCLLVDGQAAPG